MRQSSVWTAFWITLTLYPLQMSGITFAAPLPKPENIACQGYERDTVSVSWKDTATDESNYRVERQIGTGTFTEVATISPDASGNYPGYQDKGADVSSQNRHYRVRSFRATDSTYSPYSDICNNRRIFDPGNFRIFYGLRGTADECPQIDGQNVCLADVNTGGVNTYVGLESNALQGSADAFNRVGFTRSAIAPPSGLDKIPINVVWCDGGGCAGGGGLSLSPSLLETPFDLTTRTGDPIAWLVAEHEAFHFQQYQYAGLNDPASGWVYEGQARSSQDKICIGANRSNCQAFDDINTGYAGYIPEVNGYLGDPSRSINQIDYAAALFWTYLTEKYGTSSPSDTVEGGMNLMVRFWEESAANPNRDGITVLNSTLAALGHTARFRDIWKDFAVANYAKNLNGPGVKAKYLYADMAQAGGSYAAVRLDIQRNLNVGDQVVDTDETVRPWAARYYELKPAASLPIVDIKINQDSNVPVYYTILGIKGTDIVYEDNLEARNLNRSLINNGYDKVAVIVAGLDNPANYRCSFNGTQPTLRILSPTTANKARVGNPSSPDKFRVAVEIVAADGTPLSGVDPANFSFRVGAIDLPSGNVLTSATIQGQQWFVVRAPGQMTAGRYDLLVRYGATFTSTQSLAVDYTPRTDADSLLLTDRSGSMGDFGKMESAKSAARLYVDSWRGGDTIGVLSFNESNTLDLGLTGWTDAPGGGSRQTALDKINTFSAGGDTALGDVLRKGWNEVSAKGNSSHDWALVLLSDGLETAGTEKFDDVINALASATSKRPVVHTVAVGPDADRIRMQSLANQTGGTYQYVSTPAPASMRSRLLSLTPGSNLQLDMDLRYRVIATNIVGQQQFFSLTGPLTDDQDPFRDNVLIPVEKGSAELVVSLSWDPGQGSIGNVFLRDANNAVVNPFERDVRHIVWRVPSPTGGTWNLEINRVEISVRSLDLGQAAQQSVETLSPYLIQAALRSDVTMEAYLTTPVEKRVPGVSMPILVSLTDTAPIIGAIVRATIQQPAGGTVEMSLFDDGAHDDGKSHDGIYGNTFHQTGSPGSYNIAVNASGSSALSGVFTRQAIASFHIHSTGDRDGDGLPNEWESAHGTNPDRSDANSDPDNDGLPNSKEWESGTDPQNPDSDHGGEADGTDPNPLDPADDSLEPTWTVAYPGNKKVFVKYVLRQKYAAVDLFRSDNPRGPFTFVQRATPGTGIMTDTTVVNNNTYCYQAIAENNTGRRSAGMTPSCTTPKTDPLAPHGSLLINGGARETTDCIVRLDLWASDSVSPEFVPPGDEILVPPADSASGVESMMISNRADMADGTWEPYGQHKTWQLAQASGLASVFVKYRDLAGNESSVIPATIHVNFPSEHCVPVGKNGQCGGVPATIVGTEGNDILHGTPGDDVIVGLGGNDIIDGMGGNDLICGGVGNDRLTGGPGNDKIDGGEGNDVIHGMGGNDILIGGDGNDVLTGGPEDDKIDGGEGNDVIHGMGGKDALIGSGGNDVLDGSEGDDFLDGGPGNDALTGGAGNDVLNGGEGNDACDGGSGTDSASGCEAVNNVP